MKYNELAKEDIIYHVYLIQSQKYPEKTYVGFTRNLADRLKTHNSGNSKYTAKYKPWHLNVSINFESPDKAKHFEKYLKTASGKAFINRHFQ